jgi:hypothetical protein
MATSMKERPVRKLSLATVAAPILARTVLAAMAAAGAASRARQERPATRAGSRIADVGAVAESKACRSTSDAGVEAKRARHGVADERGPILACVPVGRRPVLPTSPQARPQAPEPPRPGGGADAP